MSSPLYDISLYPLFSLVHLTLLQKKNTIEASPSQENRWVALSINRSVSLEKNYLRDFNCIEEKEAVNMLVMSSNYFCV